MSYIITIAQRKGGAGKTTLACQLAVALHLRGMKISIIDMDDQQSFSAWANVRGKRYGETDFAVETGIGFGFFSAMRRAKKSAEIILIDTAPTTDINVSRAIAAGDLVLCPMQLSPLDLDASMPTAKLIGDMEKPAFFVINRAPPRARVADLIRSKIKGSGLPTLKTELGNRTAFSESLATGRGVMETNQHNIATQEIRLLTDEVLQFMRYKNAA